MRKGREYRKKTQEHMLSFFGGETRKERYEEMAALFKDMIGNEGMLEGSEGIVKGGCFLAYYQDIKKHLQKMTGLSEEAFNEKYGDEGAWNRYMADIKFEIINIWKNPQGGGLNYLITKKGAA